MEIRKRHDTDTCDHCRHNRRASTGLTKRPPWVQDAIFYQVFPDRFAPSPAVAKPRNLEPWDTPPTVHGYKGGDLVGVVEHLDWIHDLGANAIYLNPIFRSASNHRYHTHDYFVVDPLLGGDEAFDQLLAACHARGIRVVLDGVFNHSSRGFFQFSDVLENGSQSPYADWFHIHDYPLHPYSEAEPANYAAWWGLRALPEFNIDNPEVREFLMRVGEHWTRRGIDGWRLDVPGEIQTPGFWEEFRTRVRALNPDLYIVGEVWHEAGDWINDGTRFDATMNYPFTTATIAYAIGSRLDHDLRLDNPSYTVAPPVDAAGYRHRLTQLLSAYPEDATRCQLNLLDSHDTARIVSLASHDIDSVVVALALLFTFPGAPCIYYGTEIGLAGRLDPDNRRSFPWNEPETWNRRVLDTVKDLAMLRSRHRALRSGRYDVLWPDPDGGDGTMAYAFARVLGDERIITVVNAGDERESHSIPYDVIGSAVATPLWGEAASIELGTNHIRLSMAPRSAAMWLLGAE